MIHILALVVAFLRQIFAEDEFLEAQKELFCEAYKEIDGACKNLRNRTTIFLFAQDVYFEMDIDSQHIYGAQKIASQWPEVPKALSAVYSFQRRYLHNETYIFVKGDRVWIYDDPKNRANGVERDLEEFQRTWKFGPRIGQSLIPTCMTGDCFVSKHCDYIAVYDNQEFRAINCSTYAGSPFICTKYEHQIPAPRGLEPDLLSEMWNQSCNALVFQSDVGSQLDHRRLIYVDEENMTIWRGNEKWKKRSINEIFDCQEYYPYWKWILLAIAIFCILLLLTVATCIYCNNDKWHSPK